eukprot:TRINITY_DN4011_c0_g1_i1.p1 TRINITY_DN4011_c0_g1~~TRINITY_DN4011_c0_g1_i1.p1  ORF type:complete len:747 (-),score=192.39 TRINITY_DN4011_c0_g1_i1:189-2429(-)
MGKSSKTGGRAPTAPAKLGLHKKSNSSMNPNRRIEKGQTHMRDRATINRLNMYRSKPIRDSKGTIIGGEFMSRTPPKHARVMADRRWFGNTRTVGVKELEKFRQEVVEKVHDPYTVLLHQKKLPMGLITDPTKVPKMDLESVEKFEDTFGKKARRKRPKLHYVDIDAMKDAVQAKHDGYTEEKDSNIKIDLDFRVETRESIFDKGQSKRIWGELYKVIDSSDVLVQVLDARDPMGTRSKHVEQVLRTHNRHKHLVFVLNKCDLVPTWVTARWVKVLSREYPTLAFHASITNPFGKGSLIQLLRQFSRLHGDKKQLSVGFIGYPNVGKSSVINTLRKKKVCKVAPVPGETKVWQYITLFKRIYLIDCPGVVYSSGDSEADIVLKGVVRIENLQTPEDYIDEVIRRVKKEYLQKTYKIDDWTDTVDFLEKICRNTGRLLKGGEPDIKACAKTILQDCQRGRVPFFSMPPMSGDSVQPSEAAQNPDLQITQQIRNISVRVEYNEEDNRAPEGLSEVDLGDENAINWDDIYESENESDQSETAGEEAGSDDDQDSNQEDEDGEAPKKVAKPDASSVKAKKTSTAEKKRKADQKDDAPLSWDDLIAGNQEESSDDEEATIKTRSEDQEREAPSSAKAQAKSGKSKLDARAQAESPAKKSKAQIVKEPAANESDAESQQDEDNVPEDDEASQESGDDSSEEDKQSKKDKRMTTNKKKVGTHYYATANVKNRNRNKKKVVKPAPAKPKLKTKK